MGFPEEKSTTDFTDKREGWLWFVHQKDSITVTRPIHIKPSGSVLVP